MQPSQHRTPRPLKTQMRAITLTLALAALCGLALASEGTEHPLVPCPPQISDKCPAEDPPTPVYFPQPDDCSKFCVCSGGNAYEESCLPGLVWDDQLHVCNWPSAVDCGSRPIP